MSRNQSDTNDRRLSADGLSSPVRYALPAVYGALLAIGLLLSACGAPQTNTPVPTTLRIAGSTSLKPTLSELAAAYQAGHPQTVVEVLGGGLQSGSRSCAAKKLIWRLSHGKRRVRSCPTISRSSRSSRRPRDHCQPAKHNHERNFPPTARPLPWGNARLGRRRRLRGRACHDQP